MYRIAEEEMDYMQTMNIAQNTQIPRSADGNPKPRARGLRSPILAAVLFMLGLIATSVPVHAMPTSCGAATQLQGNGGFEIPNLDVGDSSFESEADVPSWSTSETLGQIEILQEEFNLASTPAHTGDQFAEINALSAVGSLSQSFGISPNAEVVVTWAHRARPGNSPITATAEFTDDTGQIFNPPNFTANDLAWVENGHAMVVSPTSSSLTIAFAGTDPALAEGNFLDTVTACQTFLTLTVAEVSRDDRDGDGGDSVGDEIFFEFTISNPAGNLNPVSGVTITDSLLGTINVTAPTSGDTNGDGILDPGETWVVEQPYWISQEDLDDANTTGDLDLSPDATVTGNTGFNDISSNEATYSAVLAPNPEIGAVKSVDTISIKGDGTFDVIYRILVENTGNVTLTPLSLNDDLSAPAALSGAFNGVSAVPTVALSANVSGNAVSPTSTGTAFTGTGGGTALLIGSDGLLQPGDQ